MKKIVLSAIAAILMTFGVYHIALLMGASEPVALTAIAATGFAVAFVVVVTLAFAAATGFAVAFAVVVALAVAAAFVAAFALAFAAIFAFAIAVDAAEQEHIQFRWMAPVYAVEGLAIGGALTVGNPVWSAAIALGGIAALLVLWRLAPEAPEPSEEEMAAAARDARRARIVARLADLEGELARERERLAALDAPPAAEAVLDRNGA